MNISALKNNTNLHNPEPVIKTGKSAGILSRLFRRTKEFRILSVIGDDAGLYQINSVIQFCTLIKSRYPDYKIHILTTLRHHSLFSSLGIIDSLHLFEAEGKAKSIVRSVSPRVLYVPFQGFLTGLRFTGTADLRIGSEMPGWWAGITRTIALDSPEGLARIHEKGLNLYPLNPVTGFSHEASAEDYILFNVFPEDGKTSHHSWSVSHVSRFLRLCSKDNLKVRVPVFTDSPQSEINYLRSRAPDAQFEEISNTSELLKLIQESRLVVGVRSEELKLAHLVGKPSLMLDSYSRVQRINTATVLIRPGKHLDDCDDNCDNCAKGNCIDLISPERVHEAVLKILSPV